MSMSDGTCGCCYRRDGITSGGCVYCSSQTLCGLCSRLLSCGCGRQLDAHVCPNISIVSAVVATPVLVICDAPVPALSTIALAVMGAVSVGATSVQTPATGELHTTPIRAKPTAEVVFEQYLWRLELTNGGRFPTPHVQAARVVWERFRSLSAAITPPQTAPTPAGMLSMVWDVGVHHLEVDIGADRKVTWFYTNRSTGQYEGKEGSLAEHLPRRLEDIVRGLTEQEPPDAQ